MTRYNVGVVKLPYADRHVEHEILGERPGEKFKDLIGADTHDNDKRFPVGSNTTYNAEMTPDEVCKLEQESHVRYVSEDKMVYNVKHAATLLPQPNTWNFFGGLSRFTSSGTGVKIAILDEGTTAAFRSYKNITLSARTSIATPAPSGEIYAGEDHGCLCAGVAVPYGGSLIDVITIGGTNNSSDSWIASAINYAVAQGAKVVSASMGLGTTPAPASSDAMVAASGSDVVFYWSAGNGAGNIADYPSGYSSTISYCYRVGAWDVESQKIWYDSPGLGSNWGTSVTGVAPGIFVWTADDPTFVSTYETQFYGTSAACPHVANACARLISGGVTARQAGAALAATTRDLGQAPYQSGGAFDINAAAEYLNIMPPQAVGVDPNIVTRAQFWW